MEHSFFLFIIMTYNKQIRKLAIQMIKKYGIVKTSSIINISRTTLWRWKNKGIENKKRLFQSELFNKIKDILKIIFRNKYMYRFKNYKDIFKRKI